MAQVVRGIPTADITYWMHKTAPDSQPLGGKDASRASDTTSAHSLLDRHDADKPHEHLALICTDFERTIIGLVLL